MSLKQYKNIGDIQNTKKLQRGVRYYEISNNQLPSINFYSNFDTSIYDVLELHIYDDVTDKYIASNQTAKLFYVSEMSPTFENKPTVILNPQQDLLDLQLGNGRYKIVYNFMRDILGSFNNVNEYLYIENISTDGTELRVLPVNPKDDSFISYINDFTNIDRNTYTYWPDCVMNFSKNKIIPIINWQLDTTSTPEYPYSLLLKLYEPLPGSIKVKDLFWISTEVSSPIIDRVFLDMPLPPIETGLNYLKSANFNLDLNQKVGYETEYKSWNEILGTNQNSMQQILDLYLNNTSGSIKGIELNVDYSNYDNFVHFSSATERLYNFKYKLELLESYSSSISNMQNMVSGSATGSVVLLTISQSLDKSNKIKSTFDGFEKYMYYESGSNYISSNGLSLTRAWPKQTLVKPYTLYNTTSSIAETWFSNQIASAQEYDRNNRNALIESIPMHIRSQENTSGEYINQSYELFVNMLGHYYDIIWLYIENLTQSYNREQKLTQGIAKDLIYHFVESFGWDLDDGIKINDLWEYSLGIDEGGNYITGSDGLDYITPENRQKEIWKRIYNNLPLLLKEKGTARGIKALISCYGVPSTVLRIKEYGGTSYQNSEYEIDKYTNALVFHSQSITVPADYLSIGTTQFRFKPCIITPIPLTQSLYASNTININLYYNESVYGNVDINGIQLSNLPIFDGNYWNIMLADSGSYHKDFYIYRFNNDRFTYKSSSSIYLPFFSMSNIVLGSSLTFNNYFTGSMQEFRIWNTPLSEYEFQAYCKNPDAYFTATPTSSYDALILRYTLSDPTNYTTNSTVVYDSNPSQTTLYYGTSSITLTTASFESFIETRHIKTPKYWGNKINSDKIRFESASFIGDLSSVRKMETFGETKTFDSPKIGINFSPTDMINEDIFAQLGDFILDNYIGNPASQFESSYKDLDKLREFYFKKYPEANNIYNFIKYINIYDTSLFKQIKKLLPERNNAIVGLAIESHILERPKYEWKPVRISSQSLSDTVLCPLNINAINIGEQATNKEYLSLFTTSASYIGVGGTNKEYLTLFTTTGSNNLITSQIDDLNVYNIGSTNNTILISSQSLCNWNVSSIPYTQLSKTIDISDLYSCSWSFGTVVTGVRQGETIQSTEKTKFNEFRFVYNHYIDDTYYGNCIPDKIMNGTFFVEDKFAGVPQASLTTANRVKYFFVNVHDIYSDNRKMFLNYMNPPTDTGISRYLSVTKIIDDSTTNLNLSTQHAIYEIFNTTQTYLYSSSSYVGYTFSKFEDKTIYYLYKSGSELYAGTNTGVYKSNDTNIWYPYRFGNSQINTIVDYSNIFNFGTNDVGVYHYYEQYNQYITLDTGKGNIIYCLVHEAGLLWIGTNDGLYQFDESTFNPVQFALNARKILSLCFGNDGYIYAGTDTEIFVSTDGGATFSSTLSAYTNHLILSASTIWAATNNNVYYTNDQGNNWTIPSTDLNGVTVYTFMLSGSDMYVGTNQGVYVTSNSGKTWTQMRDLTTNNVYSIVYDNNNVLLAGTDDGLYYYNTAPLLLRWIKKYNNVIEFSPTSFGNISSQFGNGDICNTSNGSILDTTILTVSQSIYSDISYLVFKENVQAITSSILVNTVNAPGKNYSADITLTNETFPNLSIQIPVLPPAVYGQTFLIDNNTKYQFYFYSEKIIQSQVYHNYYDDKKYRGFLNTALTTIDGKQPVEIFLTNTAVSIQVKNKLDNDIAGLKTV